MNSKSFIGSFIIIFQIFSLLPPIVKNRRNHVQFHLWAIVNLALVFFEVVLIYVYIHEVFHSTSSIGALLDSFQVFAPICNHFVMIIETLSKQKEAERLWSIMDEIDELSTAMNIRSYAFVGTVVRKAISLLMFGIIIEIAIVASIYWEFPAFARSWYFRIWSLNVVRVGLLELVLYLEWIANQMRMICNELDVIALKDRNVVNVYLLKEQHAKLWRFAGCFNDRFGWSMLMMALNLFVCITVALYWVITRLYFARFDLMLQALLIMISPIATLVVLVHSCENCIYQIKYLGAMLHRIRLKKSGNIALERIEQFSYQIRMLPININGCGFFKINYLFLCDVISSIASYLLMVFSMNSKIF